MPKVVAIVPCRKRSKRILHKNTLPIAGKPLFQWTVDMAIELDFVDEVIVATDDEVIVDRCIDLYVGGNKVRIYDDYLAGENGRPTQDIVRDCLKGYPLDTIIIWLQPTTPLRTAFHISRAFQFYKKFEIPLTSAYINDRNKWFQLNGGIYILKLEDNLHLKNFIGGEFMLTYFMSKKDSIDIDEPEDFMKARFYMEKRLKEGL